MLQRCNFAMCSYEDSDIVASHNSLSWYSMPSVQSPSALTGTNSRCPLHRPEARRHPRQWTVEATSNFVICSVWMYHRTSYMLYANICKYTYPMSARSRAKFAVETNPDFWTWKLYFCNTHAQAIYMAYIIYVCTYTCIQLFIHLWSRQAGAKFH